MAINKEEADDLESWLDGLGSLRDKLLQQGLKTKEELLWLSQSDIDKICQENQVPLFEKKRLEMKLLALEALSRRSKSPSPNASPSRSTRYHRDDRHHTHNGHKSRKHSNQSTSSIISTDTYRGHSNHQSHHSYRPSSRHNRHDSALSNFSVITRTGDDDFTVNSRTRQPTIVRIVFSEAEEAKLNLLDEKLAVIQDKNDQITQNMSALSWEKDRLEKRIDKIFDDIVLELQQRRSDVKNDLTVIYEKQMKTMKGYITSLNKQTKLIKDSQKKCEKYLSNAKLSKSSRKSKVLKVANKALDDKTDEKIVVPEINNKKQKHRNESKKKKESKKTYFITLELDESEIKRYIQNIGDIRRVLVPYPPKFEIFTIEATRIKLKVWDQHNSTSKLGKKEKTEFIAKIAEQISRHAAIEEEREEMPGQISNVHQNGEINDNIPDLQIKDDEKQQNGIEEEEEEEDEQQEEAEQVEAEQVEAANDNNNDNDNDEDEHENENELITVQQSHDNDHHDDIAEEVKYNGDNSAMNGGPGKQIKRRESRRGHKKRRKKRGHVDWEQYPVFKPHDINDRKVMSNKYTIWIDNLKPNTTYLLKLRGYNKYGYGDWTKVYQFVTKLTSFEFKSSVIKDVQMKNAVFDILCKKLTFAQSPAAGMNSPQFALKRLFSTESQGFSARKFHETCDNKERTLIIAESEYGNIFGGYTDSKWTSPKQDKWKVDANAFLFLLRDGRRDVNMTFDCIDQYNAIRSNINSGPCFGAGFDLFICDNCNKSSNCYSTPKSYNIPQEVSLGGRKNFKIKNFDVYIVV